MHPVHHVSNAAPTPVLNQQQQRAVHRITTLAANQRVVPFTQATRSVFLDEYYAEVQLEQQQFHQERVQQLHSAFAGPVPLPPPPAVHFHPPAIHLPMPPLIIFGPPGTGNRSHAHQTRFTCCCCTDAIDAC